MNSYDSVVDDADYEVERVLDLKDINGVRHYLLKWKGKFF